MRKIPIVFIGSIIAGGIFFVWFRVEAPSDVVEEKEDISLPVHMEEVSKNIVPSETLPPQPKEKNIVFAKPYDMPFVPQAPDGNWKNPLYQDGCEEASILLSVRFLEGKTLSVEAMKSEMRTLAAYLEKQYGTSRDLSLSDAMMVLREYFNLRDIEYYEVITKEDIRMELRKGNILLVQTDGRALRNPHYTAPGPERHMLVAIGYDEKTDEVITNDPGTKFGKNYRYSLDRLFEAIQEYPTGDHLPIPKPAKKSMIVFRVSHG